MLKDDFEGFSTLVRGYFMNGYELYEKIKKMDHKVKVRLLTAYG